MCLFKFIINHVFNSFYNNYTNQSLKFYFYKKEKKFDYFFLTYKNNNNNNNKKSK